MRRPCAWWERSRCSATWSTIRTSPPVGAADAIVFAAGAGPGSGAARKETVNLGGAVKMIAAANSNQIRRFVMISALGVDTRAADGVFGAYLQAKAAADRALQASGLDFTIVRRRLTDDPATGLVAPGTR